MAKKGELTYFSLNIDKFDDCVKTVLECMKRHYPDNNIPLHSRFRHFSEEQLSSMMKQWQNHYVDKKEQVRRLVDLVTISVLLDAGAGATWKYITSSGDTLTRSEGLAAASLDMFESGLFSSDCAVPTRVNSCGLLQNMTAQKLQVEYRLNAENDAAES